MKKKLFLSLLIAAFAVSQLSAQMLVGSYNIRLKVSSDSLNGNVWQNAVRSSVTKSISCHPTSWTPRKCCMASCWTC